ncbi:Lipoxygenase-likey domain-containing protein 1 [Exaiptasia diaphana]|nr:Lipoxygenase-likey domain-containing protein 1 [Exaiptasia diaphana]
MSCPSTDVYFTVRVQTDGTTLSGSGTDCFIYLKLHGESGTSTEFELDLDDAGSSDLFETGSDDTFSKMAYKNNLGSITGISVRMVSHGSYEAWWPNTFIVTDPVNSQTKTFTNSKWLYPSEVYGTSNFPKQT